MKAQGIVIATYLLISILGSEVPYKMCAESKSWVRPDDQIQSKIWKDPRYVGGGGKNAYEWTHHFLIWYGGASGQYHLMNLTGLHTANDLRWLCSEREREEKVSTGEYVELWILLYNVKRVRHEGPIYTVTVETVRRGVQFIEFPRAVKGALTFRFVAENGNEIGVLTEGVTPGTFVIN